MGRWIAQSEKAETKKAVALPRAVLLVVGIVLIAVSTALGVWIYFHGEPPFTMDVWWNALLADSTSTFLLVVSQVMDWLGGGWVGVFVVPGAIAIVLVVCGGPGGRSTSSWPRSRRPSSCSC